VGSTAGLHQANARLEEVHGRGNVGQAMTAEYAAGGEELYELTAGAIEPREPREGDDPLLVVVGQ
jgi:hypothetical protein